MIVYGNTNPKWHPSSLIQTFWLRSFHWPYTTNKRSFIPTYSKSNTNLWMLRLVKNPEIPHTINSGWIYTDDKKSIIPKWSDLPVVSAVLQQLIKCKCKKKCTGNCKCHTWDLKCTSLCICQGKCFGATLQ